MEKNEEIKKSSFSKNNRILEIFSKQSQVKTKNVVAPKKPKEIKKKWGDIL